MGLIVKLLSFTRAERNGAKLSDVKVNPGGGANITGEHFADPGDDSHPLNIDYAAAIPIRRSGGAVVVGYADPVNEPKAAAGEKRIYGRDPSTGAVVNEVWLKSDSSVIISNALGAIELKADGTVDINGAIIDIAGNITSPTIVSGATVAASTSLTVSSKEMGGHIHPQGNDSDGDTQVNTGGPV